MNLFCPFYVISEEPRDIYQKFVHNLPTTPTFPWKKYREGWTFKIPMNHWGLGLCVGNSWVVEKVFIFKARWLYLCFDHLKKKEEKLHEVDRWGIPGLSEYLWGGTKLAGMGEVWARGRKANKICEMLKIIFSRDRERRHSITADPVSVFSCWSNQKAERSFKLSRLKVNKICLGVSR